MRFVFQRALQLRKHYLPYGQFYNKFSTARVFGGSSDSKYIISGRKLDPISGVTIPEFVFSNISKHGNKPAYTCAFTKRSFSFKELYAMSHGFAAALMQSGLKKGDVVGIMMPNLPEYPIVELGVWLAGGVCSPVSSGFTPDEAIRQCKIAEVKCIVTMPFFLELVKKVKSQVPSIQSIIHVGVKEEGTHCFYEMVKANFHGVEFFSASSIDTENDLALLPFSSGTTGPPKAVGLTHKNVVTNINQYLQPDVCIITEYERYIGLLPFYHCYGSGCLIVGAIKIGAHVYTMPKFEPSLFIEAIRKHKPTTLHVVTPIIQFMVQSPEFGKAEFESIHTIISGAAPAGKRLVKALLDKAGKFVFFQEGYGMTEVTCVSHVTRAKTKNEKIGSIGQVFPGTSCKVVNVETREALPHDTPGELCIKGPQIMKGYYNNEAATKETINSEGWLSTGDIAIYDDSKCFYIVDRLKELIKVKGLQVSPSELEDLLRTNTEILDVAVVGVKHEKFGEAPRAYIVRKSEKLTVDKVHDFLDRKIAEHKKLSGGVEFVESIPRAPSGKILRRLIVPKDPPKG